MEKYLDDKIKELEVLLYNDSLSTYGAGLLDAYKDVKKQLALLRVVGQSEQLLAFKEWERNKCRLPWDADPKDIVEQYLSQ